MLVMLQESIIELYPLKEMKLPMPVSMMEMSTHITLILIFSMMKILIL